VEAATVLLLALLDEVDRCCPSRNTYVEKTLGQC